MIEKELIRKIAEEHLAETEMFIVEVSVSVTNVITILLDSIRNVSIGDCIALSKHIESKLDRDAEDFELLVSSAGVGEPLKLEKQFKKNIGRLVEITDASGNKNSGVLKEVNDNIIGVEITRKLKIEGKKRKELVTSIESFNVNEMKSVVVIPEIKKKNK